MTYEEAIKMAIKSREFRLTTAKSRMVQAMADNSAYNVATIQSEISEHLGVLEELNLLVEMVEG